MAYSNLADAKAYLKSWYQKNRERVIAQQKVYRESNPGREKLRSRRYYQTHKKQTTLRVRRYAREHPEASIVKDIRQRCYNPNTASFKYYGARGIKCRITSAEIRYLWNRDRAYLMERPSIDRIDSSGDYELGNCRFIENKENGMRALHPHLYR